MNQSEHINELLAALAKAQGSMSAAAKDSANPFFKSKYADLNSIWNACREPLSANGLAVVQTVQQRESGDVLYTMLGHSSGQWIGSSLPLRIKSDGKTNELQVMGSCLTYLRRYALAAIVGVAPDEDDDGNSAKGYQAKPEIVNPPPVQVITKQQSDDLRIALTKCSPALCDNINAELKKRGLQNFTNIGVKLFENLMQAIDSDIAEQAKKTNAEVIA